MRRLSLLAVVVLTAALLGAAPGQGRAALLQLDPGVGGFVSPNVQYLGTLAHESPGIGARALTVGDQTRFYMTGAKGLSIYDVTNPAIPVPMGTLPLPHFQNEDVDVSDDGNRVIISTDTAAVSPTAAGSSGDRGTGIRIIDTSDPMLPRQVGFVPRSNHTTTCADAKCEWLYGSNGRIYDATDPGNITEVGEWGARGHALNRDASGLMISDSNPRLVLDVSNPAEPQILAKGTPNTKEFGSDGYLQHNNVRPDADQWVPREPGDDSGPVRPGELLIGNSESNLNFDCDQAGGLSTWDMRNFDRGAPMKQVDVFRPLQGDYNSSGDPAINALGCSGHWFTEHDGLVAAAWYEHGVRMFDIDDATLEIQQVGFFQPVATEAGAAHWLTDADGNTYIYSVDYARGIDILRFDRDAPRPTQAEFDASWLANLGKVGPAAAAERLLCRIGARSG